MADAQGHTIPLEATRGQLHWSMRGADNLVLIGRAEQVDIAHGLSSSYACQMCCDPNPYEISCLPEQVTGFPGDTTQFSATQRDIDCYGFISEPYAVFDVSWLSSAPGVASVEENGVATGQSPSSTTIRASWWVGVWRFDLVHGLCKATPQQLIANAACDVVGIDLTIDPGETRPAGTGGSSTATVTVRTTPNAIANQAVNLTLSPGAEAGGHANHAGVRPLGTLAATQGVTDANGVFSTTYTAPAFGGDVNISAAFRDVVNTTATVRVLIPNLSQLGAGENYNLVGATGTHPTNHYGTATALSNLPLIANDYKAQFYSNAAILDGEKPRLNDMSLVYGGKFDIAGDWSLANVRHAEHRAGINCDFFSANVPGARWGAITDIFGMRGSPNYNDETSCCNHWHLRFQ